MARLHWAIRSESSKLKTKGKNMQRSISLTGWSSVLIGLCLLAPTGAQAEPEADDRTLVPQPAEIMPKAIESTLLDIHHTGERFIVVGDRGHILISEDGQDWQQLEVPVRAMLNRLRMLNSKTGWVVGHDGTVLRTDDGGLSWTLQHFDAEWGKPFYDVLFLDEQNGMVIGANGRAIRTRDGGSTWEEMENPVFDLGLHLNVILRLGDGSLFLAGERSLLARSSDNGENWELLTSPYSGSWFNALPYGETGMVAFGLRGNTYLADNVAGLATENVEQWSEYDVTTQTDADVLAPMGWRLIDNPVIQSLFGGSSFAPASVVLVGVNGTIVRGDLDNNKLEKVPNEFDAPLSDAILVNNKLYVVGRNGVGTFDW